MLKKTIHETVMNLRDELQELSDYIYAHPELGFEEHLSSKAHVELLERHGFEVEMPYLGFETAFRATFKGEKDGPTIAFLSEYDALPGVGHGCGHNLLGATDTGAGIALSKLVNEIGGTVVVLGTPAEETSGVKVDMANQGTFDDIDVALCTHPADGWYESGTSMAMEALEFEFYGKTAHAAGAPYEGLNALDAVINMFNNISTLRQQIRPEARVHGVIKDGGEAANVIPDYTRAQFYVRAMDMPYLKELKQKVIRAAEAGALAAGCTVEYDNFENSYNNMITNNVLSDRFNEITRGLGIEFDAEERESMGSMDMGNVSQVVPAINPYYGITNGQKMSGHTVEFRECTRTEAGYQSMMTMIEALVRTSYELITEPQLLKDVNEEFHQQVSVTTA